MRVVVQRVLSASVTVDGRVVGAIESPGLLVLLGVTLLVVSQFTLYGNARKGRRPTWQAAAPRPVAEPVYDDLCDALERLGASVARGCFGADMVVSLQNDGPVTMVIKV